MQGAQPTPYLKERRAESLDDDQGPQDNAAESEVVDVSVAERDFTCDWSSSFRFRRSSSKHIAFLSLRTRTQPDVTQSELGTGLAR